MFLLIFLTNTMQLILSCKAQSDPYLFFEFYWEAFYQYTKMRNQ